MCDYWHHQVVTVKKKTFHLLYEGSWHNILCIHIISITIMHNVNIQWFKEKINDILIPNSDTHVQFPQQSVWDILNRDLQQIMISYFLWGFHCNPQTILRNIPWKAYRNINRQDERIFDHRINLHPTT